MLLVMSRMTMSRQLSRLMRSRAPLKPLRSHTSSSRLSRSLWMRSHRVQRMRSKYQDPCPLRKRRLKCRGRSGRGGASTTAAKKMQLAQTKSPASTGTIKLHLPKRLFSLLGLGNRACDGAVATPAFPQIDKIVNRKNTKDSHSSGHHANGPSDPSTNSREDLHEV